MNNNIKEKCDKLIKNLFGYNFYFIHSTYNIIPIFKSGEIKISTEVKKKYIYFRNFDSEPYAYANMMFDDDNINMDHMMTPYTLILDPRIMFDYDVIYNKQWWSEPMIVDNETGILSGHIKLNKNDSKETRIKNIQYIRKNIIEKKAHFKTDVNDLYTHYHEILFSKNIDVRKYLIGVICIEPYFGKKNKYVPKIEKLLKKYKSVKIYKTSEDDTEIYPKLLDVLC